MYAATFWGGLLLGFLLSRLLKFERKKYSGTIFVKLDDASEKIVYTLELDDYPETLRFQKMVVFKVENSNRD
jgi:hypothetical protein